MGTIAFSLLDSASLKDILRSMQYASLDFTYTGPYSNHPDGSPEANKALTIADRAVHEAATERGVEMVHEYLWPDGSLYKMIRVPTEPHREAILIMRRADEIAKAFGVGVTNVLVTINATGKYHGVNGDIPIETWFNQRLRKSTS
jgi:hypothetical protein